MTRIRLEEACVRDAKGRDLLAPLSLEIGSNETLVLCGASGAGKSLLIELVAGLRKPDDGRVLLDEVDIHRIPPAERHVGLLTQDAALYDHLSIRENVAFGIRADSSHKKSPHERIESAARIAQCSDLLERTSTTAGQLSGGERRRVALAKALATDGQILLLDEPMEGLDQATHDAIRIRLREKLQARNGPTIIALHDREDAIALADRILLLEAGKSLQIDSPQRLSCAPASVRVAQLFANPSPAVLDGRIQEGGIALPGGSVEYTSSFPPSTAVHVIVPAHQARLGESGLSGWRVQAHEPTSRGLDLLLGHDSNPEADMDSLLRVCFPREESAPPPGEAVTVVLSTDLLLVFAQTATKCDHEQPIAEE